FVRKQQALHDAAVDEMLVDDLVYVGLVHVGVPGLFWIHHDHGTLGAAIDAARHVDADLARTGQLEFLDAIFRVVAHLHGAVVGAALLAVRALVAAKKHVPFVVAHENPSAGEIERPQHASAAEPDYPDSLPLYDA